MSAESRSPREAPAPASTPAGSARLRRQLGTLALDVDLAGRRGVTALVGPNGAGKTTLLRTLAGAHRPASGRIVVGGGSTGDVLFDDVAGVNRPPEARSVGYVPQGYGLFPHLSALDNVAFALAGERGEAERWLARLGAGELAPRRPSALSGGEQQRVALARALARRPRLLLLDEPLAALDVAARRRVRQELAGYLRDEGVPAIVVTHDARDIRALDADVIVLEEGRVVQRGRYVEVAEAPATEFVAELFGDGA
mgnify:CR=1 FL=1